MDDAFTFKSSSFPATTRVATFRGREAISRVYEFEVFLLVPGEEAKDFEFADAVGTKATLSLHPDRQDAFTVSGVLATVELVHAYGAFALFRAVVVPRLQRLAQTQHSRLFTQKSLPDVLKQVLDENGLTSSDFALQLSGSYAPEEHVCQYCESDLAFISRWMEHAGLYFYFEQNDEGEKLIVTDAKASHTDLPADPIRYVPSQSQDRSAGACIETFRCRASSLPTSVRLKDYDYTKPSLEISGSAAVAPSGFGEVNVHSSRAFTPGDAGKLAQIRAEEMLARQVEHFGSGTMHVRAGYLFTLEEHPLNSINQKYLAIACEHFGNMVASSSELEALIDVPYKDVYRCEVTAIPAKVQFRAERRTPWPRVHGLEHGVIDGAADNDYAQIDDHGRYKVKFLFDESPLKDGAASTWVRMMQPHGGGVEGFHFPLRKGTEVVLSFWGGDPDRPVIAGVVNTTTTPSPVTSSNNTRNVIQTGGRNRLELEDQEGIQKISLSTPTANTFMKMGATDGGHEMTMHTDANALHDIVGNHDHTVGSNLTQKVSGAVAETYSTTQTTDVSGHQKKTAGTRELIVKGAHQVTNNGHHTDTHNAGRTSTVTGGHVQSTAGGHTHTVTGGFTHTIDNKKEAVAGLVDLKWGPLTWIKGSHNCTTLGHTLDKFIGTRISMSFAASTDTVVGVRNANFLGGSATMTVGGEGSFTMGFIASLGLGPRRTTSIGNSTTSTAGNAVNFAVGTKVDMSVAKDLTKTPFRSVDCVTYNLKAGVCSIEGGAFTVSSKMVKIG